jgi:cytochrome c peroxidase
MTDDALRTAFRAMPLLVLLAVVAGACDGDGAAAPPADESSALRTRAIAAGLSAMPAEPMRPVDNPYLAERVQLGHLLFFDPILSGPKDVACSTCHLPRFAFTDGRQFPSGAGADGLGPDRTDPEPWPLRLMPRNSPPIFNVGLYGRFGTAPAMNGMMFWSGSAFGLEDQVLLPITADNELRGMTYEKYVAVDSVVARLRATNGYVERFADAFPALVESFGTDPDRLITGSTLRLAIAAYIRELVTPRAPFDDFMNGNDDALGTAAKRGLDLFIGKAGCVRCHTGPVLSDFELHVLGTLQRGLGRDTTPGDDLGWGEHGGQRYSFRTGPLRQIGETPPYFHAGTAETLEDVMRFKNAGRSEHPNVNDDDLDPAAGPLGLTEAEIADVIAFLHALTDAVTMADPLFSAPLTVPSGLEVPR